MRIAMTILAVSLALSPGCKKKKDAGVTTGSAEMGSAAGSAAGSATGSAMESGSAAMGSAGAGSDTGSAAAGTGSDTGSAAMGSAAGSGDGATMTHHAGNCPSTVFGSTTKVTAEKDTAVVVTITATDKDAIKAIHTRTDELLKGKQDKKGTGTTHDQKGTHGGADGLCPVFLAEGSKAVAKRDPKGVTVMITPKDKATVPALTKEIEGRVEKTAAWMKDNVKPGDKGNAGGVGGGKNDEGMNHSGKGDGKGIERKKAGDGGGAGTGGGAGKGSGGGAGKGSGGGNKKSK
jgi:hypothetical protein